MLELVTMTGADDQTSIDEIAEISDEYPWVEWGILVSEKHAGCSRFPSRPWIAKFVEAAIANDWHFSTHICGSWVRNMFVGALDWSNLPPELIHTTRRIQINTHAATRFHHRTDWKSSRSEFNHDQAGSSIHFSVGWRERPSGSRSESLWFECLCAI